MPRIKYQDIRLGPSKLKVVEQANTIIREYGHESLELDALETAGWQDSVRMEEESRKELTAIATNYSDIVANL